MVWHSDCILVSESRKAIAKKDNMYNHLKIELGGNYYDANYEIKQLDSNSVQRFV